MKILIIEDDLDVRVNLNDFLEGRGHTVDNAADGVSGLHLATVSDLDAIVLDVGLPGVDGLEVCRQLRGVARNTTPILMLTARDTLEDKLAGFDSGADDYLVKPFALRELEARLLALQRRGSPSSHERELRVADLTFDLDTLVVRRAGTPIALTRVGMKVLELLMRESHRVVRREEMERWIWNDDPPQSDALRTHIHALRRAIDRPFDVALLHTVPGVGYRLGQGDDR